MVLPVLAAALPFVAVGLGGAFVGSLANNATTPVRSPSDEKGNGVDLTRIMLYAGGALLLYGAAKRFKVI